MSESAGFTHVLWPRSLGQLGLGELETHRFRHALHVLFKIAVLEAFMTIWVRDNPVCILVLVLFR
jgi:hypothetical protein